MTVAWLTVSLSDSNCQKPWIVRSQEIETHPDCRDVKTWGGGVGGRYILEWKKYGMTQSQSVVQDSCIQNLEIFYKIFSFYF